MTNPLPEDPDAERRARDEAGHADRMLDFEYEIVGEIGPIEGINDI